MKQLDSKVNLIPVIAKSDIITKNELTKLREKVTNEILSNGIRIYSFPTDEVEIAEQNSQMNALQPFAVVASHDFVRIGSRQVRARQYPWGTVQGECEQTSAALSCQQHVMGFCSRERGTLRLCALARDAVACESRGFARVDAHKALRIVSTRAFGANGIWRQRGWRGNFEELHIPG